MTIRDAAQAVYQQIFKPQLEKTKEIKYAREIMIITLGAICVVSGWYGYGFYKSRTARAAQLSLTECLSEYNRVKNSKGQWSDVQATCEFGEQQHGDTATRGYFLMTQADAMLHEGDYEQAVTLFDTAINATPKESPLKKLYETKRALVLLDSSDEQTKQQGREALAVLVKEKANPYADIAHYYIGYDYWVRNELESAQQTWQELTTAHQNDEMPSPWVQLAEQKLTQLG